MKYDEAFNKNDATAVAALFTEDAVQVTPEGVLFGRHAIEKKYADSFQKTHPANHVLKTDQVISVGNETCAIGEWSCTSHGKNGALKVKDYRSRACVREGGAWKIRISTFNLVPPAETK